MTDVAGNGSVSRLQNILRKGPAPAEKPSDYAPRNARTDAEMKRLAAVSRALEEVPGQVAQSNDELAQRFLDLAESSAKSLEAMGDASVQDGQRRRDEYYRLAQATRHKGAYQAKEALVFLEGVTTIKNVSGEAQKPVISLPVEEEEVKTTEVAPTDQFVPPAA